MKLLILALIVASSMQATTLMLKSGWNLVGSNKDNVVISAGIATANSVWMYENNTWSVASPNGKYSQTTIAANNFQTFTQVNAGDGFWVDISEDTNVTLTGTEVSNIAINLQNGWNLVSSKASQEVSPQTYLDDTSVQLAWKYTTSGWEAYSNIESLKSLISAKQLPTISTLKVGEGFWINALKETYTGIVCNTNTNIQAVFNSIEKLDPTQDSLTEALNTAQNSLSASNLNENALSAIFDIMEVLNSDIVNAFIDQNTSLPNLDALSGDTNALVTLAAQANSVGGTNILHQMALKLKTASDTIAAAYVDVTNSICYVDSSNKSTSIRYDDALMLRSLALATASALDMFASYSYGDLQTYFSIKNATIGGVNYEYMLSDTDTLAMMQQSTFFKIADTARLVNAGSYLKTAADLMAIVDTTKVTINTLYPEDTQSAKKIQAAFAGDGVYMEDNITQESVNLKKLFSSTEYLDREDFTIPTSYTDYNANSVTLDHNTSIIFAKPMYVMTYENGGSTESWPQSASYDLEPKTSFEDVIVIDVQEKYFSGNTIYFVNANGGYATRTFESLSSWNHAQYSGTNANVAESGSYSVYNDGITFYIYDDATNTGYHHVYKYLGSFGETGQRYSSEMLKYISINTYPYGYFEVVPNSKVEVHTYTIEADRNADPFYMQAATTSVSTL